jgi:putative FmdB family regulatory protein
MPTYEYRCNACGHEFEIYQSMSDGTLRKCPECAKLKLERLIGTGAAIIFRGSGFYQTDYRSKEYKDQAKADKKAASDATSKSDDKSSSTKSDAPKADATKSDAPKKKASKKKKK